MAHISIGPLLAIVVHFGPGYISFVAPSTAALDRVVSMFEPTFSGISGGFPRTFRGSPGQDSSHGSEYGLQRKTNA
jgi:hypothetical protein